MKLEDQVISLELAKRLKELGVNDESYFAYFKILDYEEKWEILKQTKSRIGVLVYTTSELLYLLPSTITTHEHEEILCPDTSYQLTISKCNESEFPYCVWYYSNKDDYTNEWQQENDTLPNCLGKMLIHLTENALMKMNNIYEQNIFKRGYLDDNK